MTDEFIPLWADDEPEAVPERQRHELGEAALLGAQALELTRHPAFTAALDALARSLFSQWMATDLHEAERREGIYRMYTQLQAVAGALQDQVSRGERAADALAQ